ncbi:MAG TPA: allophanate hydrolase [Rhodocyclaceae bacterium]|nr:allophanate hydrolase [Rhodocyclaceae bacterium]
MHDTLHWTLADWRAAYASGTKPKDLISSLLKHFPDADPAWINRIDNKQLTLRCLALEQQAATNGKEALPLYGIPIAVKDNIDVAGLITTCACPEFAYLPEDSATVVKQLEAAGAVIVGKTNLDQFATGLVGTRSPYGVVPNTFDARFISGGSSSGSASVVARGLVPLALGTDTAGSGRVPAGHNNLVGFKPTRGHVSNHGLVPACRTLDCITVFSLTVEDAELAMSVMGGFDVNDPYSRHAPARAPGLPTNPVLGVPADPQWFGDTAAQALYNATLQRLETEGVQIKPLDFTPLFQVAALLYEGPWVAERYAAIEALLDEKPNAVHPVVRCIIEKALGKTAVDAFNGEYRRMELARVAESLIAGVDGLLVPTAPTIYPINEVLADPVTLNSRMGVYTNFVNLLDWSAIALPAGVREGGDKAGLPFGITVIMPAWQENRLIEFGKRWQKSLRWPLGNSKKPIPRVQVSTPPKLDGQVLVAVVGAHLSGMPLNYQLIERGAFLVEKTTTSTDYQLYALANTQPPKPGLLRGATGAGSGAAIEVEVWAMPVERFGSFVALIPAPLGIGTLSLADGSQVKGFICEPAGLHDAVDITTDGGWRNYLTRASAVHA